MCRLLCALFIGTLSFAADSSLTPEQMTALQDPQGWEYTSVFDNHNGFPLHHLCFVEGQPQTNECRGTLKLTPDGKFFQDVYIHGVDVPRHGTYDLDGTQITLVDELGTKDGPYDLVIDLPKNTMRISMNQAGVDIGATFLLESQYRSKKNRQKQSGQ